MIRELQSGLRSQEGINDHILDRTGSFMGVKDFVKSEPGCTKIINQVRILDVVTDLIFDDAG